MAKDHHRGITYHLFPLATLAGVLIPGYFNLRDAAKNYDQPIANVHDSRIQKPTKISLESISEKDKERSNFYDLLINDIDYK